MQMNTPRILGIASAAIGLLLLLLSISGLLWPATPITDPGMLWTSVTFLLLGLFSFLLGREQTPAA